MFQIIEKIKNNELSFKECLALLTKDECWKFFDKGILGIFILKRTIPFLPEGYGCYTGNEESNKEEEEEKKSFDDLINNIDITITKILSELNNSSIQIQQNNNFEDWDDEMFKLFYKKSPTYRDLFNKTNFLFKNLELHKTICLTEDEYSSLKLKVKNRRVLEIRMSYAAVHKKQIDKNTLKKTWKNDRDLVNERLTIKKEKLQNKKRDKEIGQFIFYARLLRLFYCSIFRSPFTDKNLQQIIPIHYETGMKNARLYNLFEKCKKIHNFSLRLQVFFVKNIMDDSYVYKKRFTERKNFLNEIVYKIDCKYPHLLWPIIEKNKSDLFERIRDIHSEEFAEFLEEKKNKIKLIFNPSSGEVFRWIDDLVLLFYMKSWFEDIIGIKDWSRKYVHMDIFKKKELDFKELNGQFYPIIVNLFYTCWGVLYENTVYFGKLVHVFFKYKEIIEENFNCELPKSGGIMKKVGIKKFLVFSLK